MKDKVLHIKVSEDLKKELANEAKEKGLSLAGYIRTLLIDRKK